MLQPDEFHTMHASIPSETFPLSYLIVFVPRKYPLIIKFMSTGQKAIPKGGIHVYTYILPWLRSGLALRGPQLITTRPLISCGCAPNA